MPAAKFELVVRSKETGATRHSLDPGVHVIGREAGCEIFINSLDLSRHHAKLTVSASGCVIEDLGSLNGTFVNGRQLTEPAGLESGQEFQLGSMAFELRSLPESGAVEAAQRKYAAFLSYRHADNSKEGRQWANWLHKAIETYEIPADLVGTQSDRGEEIPAHLFPVFRDEEELPADADLSTPIVRALENSRYLVVLCSPGAATSRFVADEIRRFKAMGKSDRVVAAIIAGEPNVTTDVAKQAAGWTVDQECFPEPLRYEIEADGSISGRPAEPIAADFRLEDGKEGWTNPKAYRASLKGGGLSSTAIRRHVDAYEKRLTLMKLKVIAGILGIPLGILTQRDKAHQLAVARRRAARRRMIVIALSVLAIAAIVAGGAALIQKKRAKDSQLAMVDAQKNEQATSDNRDKLLQEAAQSDREVAIELFREGEPRRALAHLARALEYDPDSASTGRLATSMLNDWRFPVPIHVFKGDGSVRSAEFSPDGQRILTERFSNVELREAGSGRILFALEGGGSPQFSPDGQRIRSGNAGNTDVIDASSGRLMFSLQGFGNGGFSPDGNRIATFNSDGIHIYDAGSGTPLTTLQGETEQRFERARFSPDGEYIVADLETERPGVWVTGVWDIASGKKVVFAPDTREGPVHSAQFSPDGLRILTVSSKYSFDAKGSMTSAGTPKAQVWEANSGKLVTTLLREYSTHSLTFSPDGTRIFGILDKRVVVFDASLGNVLFTMEGHEDSVNSVEFSSDGERVVTASKDKTARVWETGSGKLLTTLQGAHPGLRHAQFSPDGRRALVVSFNNNTGHVLLWDVGSGELLATLIGHGSEFFSAEFSPDGRQIVTASSHETARVWEPMSGKLMVALVGHEGPVTEAQFTPDGQRVFTASQKDRTERMWEPATGKMLGILQGHEGTLKSATFSPDGKRFITTSSNGRVTGVRETSTGKLLTSIGGNEGTITNAEFSPDGQRIATISYRLEPRTSGKGISGKTASVWNSGNGSLLGIFKWAEAPNLIKLSFNPDGRRIVTASRGNPAQVWDANAGELLISLQDRPSEIRDGVRALTNFAQFSPDDRFIITIGPGVRFWESASGKLMETPRISTLKSWATQFTPGDPLVDGSGVGMNWSKAFFSPDCERLLTTTNSSGSNNRAWLWDVGSGERIAALKAEGAALRNPEFSSDGQRILATTGDNAARVWDAQSGELISIFYAPGVESYSAQFSPDGRHVITNSGDRTARVWEILGTTDPPPRGFSDFLRLMARQKLGKDGKAVVMRTSEYLPLRAKLEDILASDRSRYADIARRFLNPDPSEGGPAVSVSSKPKVKPPALDLVSGEEMPKKETVAPVAEEPGVPETIAPDPTPASGEVVPTKPGKDSALRLDGTDSYVRVEKFTYDGTHSITVEAWIDPAIGGEHVVISNAEYTGMGIKLVEKAIKFSFFNGGRYSTTESVLPDVSAGKPIHVAAVFDGSEIRLYVNGIAQGAGKAIRGKHRRSRMPLITGGNPDPEGVGFGYQGAIDEVRVSSKARYTQDFEPERRFVSDEATMLLFHFDEGEGEIAKDASGNGIDGKIVGAEWGWLE